MRDPSHDAERAFEQAIKQVQDATQKLLDALPARGEPKTRDGEKAKAKAKWERRERAIRSRA